MLTAHLCMLPKLCVGGRYGHRDTCLGTASHLSQPRGAGALSEEGNTALQTTKHSRWDLRRDFLHVIHEVGFRHCIPFAYTRPIHELQLHAYACICVIMDSTGQTELLLTSAPQPTAVTLSRTPEFLQTCYRNLAHWPSFIHDLG